MRDLIRSKEATIVDVRTMEEFVSGNVENSLNIPMHEVPMRIEEFKQMSKPLILCCATGNRSGQVAKYLSSLGISDVYNAGGWVDVHYMLNEK